MAYAHNVISWVMYLTLLRRKPFHVETVKVKLLSEIWHLEISWGARHATISTISTQTKAF